MAFSKADNDEDEIEYNFIYFCIDFYWNHEKSISMIISTWSLLVEKNRKKTRLECVDFL